MALEASGDTQISTYKTIKSSVPQISTIPSSPPRKRTNAQLGTDDRVVLDIGTRFLKAGFAGEPSPRCILEFKTSDMKRHNQSQCEEACRLEGVSGVLYCLDTSIDGLDDTGLIEDRLELLLREAYSRHLLIDSKTKKAIVIENLLMPLPLKTAIVRVLFTYFQVPSITFLSSDVMSVVACGLRRGLVVNIGWYETTVVPVYDLKQLVPFIRTTPVASKALYERLLKLLQQYVLPPQTNLSLAVLQDICVKTLFCTIKSPLINSSQFDTDNLSKTYQTLSSTPEVQFPTSKTTSITIPGWIRSRTTEVLFEGYSPYADSDEVSLPRAIISSLNRLPIDIRHQLVDRILITGGASNIPGLKTRISNEVKHTISSARFIKSDIADGGSISWTGGSLIGGLKIPGIYEIKRDGFINGENVPDWSSNTR